MRNSIILALFASAFLIIAYIRGGSNIPEQLLEELNTDRLLCEPNLYGLEEDLELLTKGTSFESRVRINEKPERESLNLFFFCSRGRISDSLARLIHNCAFIGMPNLIICDATFFSYFIESSGIAGELRTVPSLEENRKTALRRLGLWVLGHEIGHIVSGHVPSHFTEGRIEKIADAGSIDHKFELEADKWLISQLPAQSRERQEIELVLLDLLFAQVRKKVGDGGIFPGTGVPITSGMIEYAEEGSHPEFVVRATRLLSLSLAESEKGFMKYQIDNFAEILRRTDNAR